MQVFIILLPIKCVPPGRVKNHLTGRNKDTVGTAVRTALRAWTDRSTPQLEGPLRASDDSPTALLAEDIKT